MNARPLEKISYTTHDGVSIAGVLTSTSTDGPWVLLLHMMPAGKESWQSFMSALAERGINSMAIDLRGHGESVVGPTGKLDHKLFTDTEHQASAHDVQAGVDWLIATHGAVRSRVALCGASIGANLALAHAATDLRVPAVVALSPGFNYRGVTTEDKVMDMPAATKVLLAASDDDTESFDCVRQLAAMRDWVTLRELRGAGHGTHMFDAAPELLAESADWLRRSLR